MKKVFLFALLLSSSIDLFAQSDDFWVTFFQKNPGSLVVVIGFTLYYLIVKPLFISLFEKKPEKTLSPVMIESIVTEKAISVYKSPDCQSDILINLNVGDKFLLEKDSIKNEFFKVKLQTGETGFISNIWKFKSIPLKSEKTT